MSLNVFSFSGRLTDTPTVKELKEHTLYNFSIAVNNYAGKDKEYDVFFVECSLWGDRGKFLLRLDKGAEMSVSGKLTVRKWTNKEGVEKTIIGCNVNDYEVHTKPKTDSGVVPKSRIRTEPVEEEKVEDEDIPF